uniref:Uncharacterized protein n=1 Tax=Nelumbo nucifera TaxID=4432 RepID=A0A822ZM34_NELNU|nr:TPA_asm: hypothetical protein HUJ06_004043 [Nelumbo nucifera]
MSSNLLTTLSSEYDSIAKENEKLKSEVSYKKEPGKQIIKIGWGCGPQRSYYWIY